VWNDYVYTVVGLLDGKIKKDQQPDKKNLLQASVDRPWKRGRDERLGVTQGCWHGRGRSDEGHILTRFEAVIGPSGVLPQDSVILDDNPEDESQHNQQYSTNSDGHVKHRAWGAHRGALRRAEQHIALLGSDRSGRTGIVLRTKLGIDGARWTVGA